VRTQGVCGGCVAFTTIACAEAAAAAGLRASTLNTLDFSEQRLFFCGDLVGPVGGARIQKLCRRLLSTGLASCTGGPAGGPQLRAAGMAHLSHPAWPAAAQL
jgi:hypothetical protein